MSGEKKRSSNVEVEEEEEERGENVEISEIKEKTKKKVTLIKFSMETSLYFLVYLSQYILPF